MYYFLLLVGIVLNVFAQILVKSAALKLTNQAYDVSQKLKSLALNPLFIGAIVLYGISFIIYTFVLSKLELSRAYPISSIGAIVLLIIFSVILFHEPLSTVKIAGVLISVVGIVLLFI